MVIADLATPITRRAIKLICSTIGISRREIRSNSSESAPRIAPQAQRSVAPVELLRRMAFMGVRVKRSTRT